MRSVSVRSKVFIGALSAFVLGTVATYAVFATIPSALGVISGCRSDSSGQLALIDSSATCGTGETSVKWDRGAVAYGHFVSDGTSYRLENRSHNVVVTGGLPELSYVAGCIDLPADVAPDVRFVTTGPTSSHGSMQVALRGSTQEETDIVDSQCAPGADAVIAGGSGYVAFF